MSRLTARIAIGLLLGTALVAWVRPDTVAGAVFLIVACCLAVAVVGGLVDMLRRTTKSPGP